MEECENRFMFNLFSSHPQGSAIYRPGWPGYCGIACLKKQPNKKNPNHTPATSLWL